MHLALGGCLKAPPISYGITADTGGHIAYVLEAAKAQSHLASVNKISIVTRLFDDEHLGHAYGQLCEEWHDKITINRVATGHRSYLDKEAIASDMPALYKAFSDHLKNLPRLPDVIHAHFSDAASVASATRRQFAIPHVYTPHALGIDKRAQQPACAVLEKRIATERRAIAMADAIIVSTRDEAERQVRAYGVPTAAERTICLSPGVPYRERQSGPRTLACQLAKWLRDPDKPIVLAIARPVRKKNLAGLVRAFGMTPGLPEQANLVILAGQDGGRPCLEEQSVIQELVGLCCEDGLSGRVALPRQHDSGDVTALYERAALGGVFANPALHEPFGLTLIEAAAAGVPVVATRNGGPVEIIESIGHGLLVDPQDEAAIGFACLRIISDRNLHRSFSRRGLLNVSRYDWPTYAAHSVSLYGSLARPGVAKAPAVEPRRQQTVSRSNNQAAAA